MKYLKTVILENFQSHKYTSINFDEGLNVILGPSDSGKSAIIRGIKWALYNEPSGDYYIREGETEAAVTLIFSDNTKVKRIRTKSKNSYILYKKNGEEIKFEGFGISVPEEIVEEIGIKKIRLDSDESNAINLGEQLEGPFLLSEKTSTRAGAIGRLIGVNVIDDALKEALRDIRNISNTKRITEERITKIEDELKEYEYLDELEIRLEKVETLRNRISQKSKRRETLINCLKRYDLLNKELLETKDRMNKLKNIEAIEPLIQKVEKHIDNFKYLNIKRLQYINYQNDIYKDTNLINRLDRIDGVNDIVHQSNTLFLRVNHLQSIKNNLDIIIKEKNISENIYNRLDKIHEVDKSLASFEKKPVIISKLIKLRDDYNDNQNNLKTGNDFIEKFSGLELSESLYKDMNHKMNKLTKLLDVLKKIKVLEINYKKEKQEHLKLTEDIRIQLNNYKDLLNKIDICPFCLSDIDQEKKEHIINHYN